MNSGQRLSSVDDSISGLVRDFEVSLRLGTSSPHKVSFFLGDLTRTLVWILNNIFN